MLNLRRKTRKKLLRVLIADAIFVSMWTLVAVALGSNAQRGFFGALIIGFIYGLYEEFYVQSPRGAWLTRHSVLFEFVVNILVVSLLLHTVMNFNHILLLKFEHIDEAYRRLPVVLPVLILFVLLQRFILPSASGDAVKG